MLSSLVAIFTLGLAASANALSICDSQPSSMGIGHDDTGTKYAFISADAGQIMAQGTGPAFSQYNTQVYCLTDPGNEIQINSGWVYCQNDANGVAQVTSAQNGGSGYICSPASSGEGGSGGWHLDFCCTAQGQ